jgi:hypothetical protein
VGVLPKMAFIPGMGLDGCQFFNNIGIANKFVFKKLSFPYVSSDNKIKNKTKDWKEIQND